MLKSCPACIHYRKESEVRLGVARGAAIREQQVDEHKKQLEQQLFDEGKPFDHKPQYFAWCYKYTPTADQLGNIWQRLVKGESTPDEEWARAKQAGLDFILDAPKGKLYPIYVLCERKNINADCPGFERSDKEQRDGQQKKIKKIVVKGSIHLGTEHELDQAPSESKRTERYATRGAGSSVQFSTTSADDHDSFGQLLEFKLADKVERNLQISDSGLVTSFGIFGAPGCGKTVLLMHLLEQVLGLAVKQPDKRYGALILDPKAALIDDVTDIVNRVGRQDDLVIVNTDFLDTNGEKINVIDCNLDPYELGAILVLAGRSAGIDASDPFWFQEWTNLFAASLSLLRADAELNMGMALEPIPVSLSQLLDVIFNEVNGERQIQRLARVISNQIDRISNAKHRHDIAIDVQMIDRFFRQEYVGTIEAFVTKAFGMFRRSRLQCYSGNSRRANGIPFYEDIIENGRIVLVSISPADPALAKTLTTLMKVLFQRTVLARSELLSKGDITNNVRPTVIACDEYSEIASEVPGQSMGDGQFLALARQYGCMALLATQSVNVLEASSLRETWRSVFSNLAAKIYMRLVDNETAEQATKLAGEGDWQMISRSTSFGSEGYSSGRQRELRERKNLPTTILTQVLKTGEAVVIGSLDGGRTRPGTYFLKVPYPPGTVPMDSSNTQN